MAIIRRKRGNVIYLCDVRYIGKDDSGKQKYKEKVLGHLDANGNFIASKGRNLNNLPAEIHEITKTTKEFRVVEKLERKEEKQNSVKKVLKILHNIGICC